MNRTDVMEAEVYDPIGREWKPMVQPLGGDFANVTEGPGEPFYDQTLNFLWEQVNRIHGDVIRLGDRIEKLQAERDAATEALEGAKAIFLTEYNEREVINPDTGEMIDAPLMGG